MSMFEPIDDDQELAILAQADKPRKTKKGPDTSVRTVTHWFTLIHHGGYCTVPTHPDNVPDMLDGQAYDKHPSRMVIQIGDYHVCRWCYIASADLLTDDPPTHPPA